MICNRFEMEPAGIHPMMSVKSDGAGKEAAYESVEIPVFLASVPAAGGMRSGVAARPRAGSPARGSAAGVPGIP